MQFIQRFFQFCIGNEREEPWLYAKRVELIYSNCRAAIFANLFNSLVISLVHYILKPSTDVFFWYLAVAVTSSYRYVLLKQFVQKDSSYEETDKWANRYILGVLQSSIVWAVASWLFFIPNNPMSQVFLIMVIAGTLSGSVGMLSCFKRLAQVYSLIIIAPLTLHLFMQASLMSVSVGFLCCFYTFIIGIMASNTYAMISESLHLQNENNILLESIKLQQKKTNQLNDQLQVKIFEQKKAEEKIKKTAATLAQQNSKLDKALAEANIANEAKSNFLANMSHEIRTPMNAIMGMVDLVLETNLANDQRENLEVAQASARSLVTIINDILDFSKVEQGKMELLPEFVDLRSLLVLLDKLFLERGRKKGVDFTPVIDGRVPSHVIVDSERLKQVLINLVENAIKFTPEGGFVMLHVLVEEIRDNKVDLLFAVADTGIGIHQDKREKIFESFTQAEQYTTRKYGGTGLGLAISSQIVNLMGGTLKVDSKEGVGSRFYFHLTLDIPPHVEVRNRVDLVIENHDDNDSSFDSLNLNILLAEDNSVNQKLFLKLLEKFGCNVSVVANGRLVLEQLQNSSFDLVLMDCQMPEMDGYEATKCIRQGEGSSDVHLPIIALTAHALESDRDRCLAVGMDDYLCKPVDKKALYKALSKVAEKRS